METLWLTQKQLDQAAAKVAKLESFNDVILIPVLPLKDNHKYIGISPTLPRYKSFLLRFRRIIRKEVTVTLENGAKIQLAETTGWELETPVQVVPEWLARMMHETSN